MELLFYFYFYGFFIINPEPTHLIEAHLWSAPHDCSHPPGILHCSPRPKTTSHQLPVAVSCLNPCYMCVEFVFVPVLCVLSSSSC